MAHTPTLVHTGITYSRYFLQRAGRLHRRGDHDRAAALQLTWVYLHATRTILEGPPRLTLRA